MIKTLSICRGDGTDPYRNLATERYLTLHTEPGECILYLWQNQRTVVIGRNQNCWKECRVHMLEEDGGHLARRLSGGGAVYHDLGNLNFTFCVRREDYDVARQLSVIVEAVRALGVAAEQTGRNDITADGKKFSGNAFYRADDFCYHHGTLLVDVDKTDMTRYLNVSRGKLETKGVDSVRSRVVNLRELNPEVSVDRLRKQMIQAAERVYGCPARTFGAERFDMDELGAYEAFFASWDWKYGKKLEFQHRMERRFPWGGIELRFRVDGGIVREAQAFSDAMDHAFVEELPALWRGRRYEADELARALEDGGPRDFADIRALRREMCRDITRLLCEEL